MNWASLFCVGFCLYIFCSLAVTAKDTKRVQNELTSKNILSSALNKTAAMSRFVQPKTNQLCTFLLEFVD